MGLVLRLVETRADGETRNVDVLELSRPGDLRDIANLDLTLPEAKQVLARVQQTVVAAQARGHAQVSSLFHLRRDHLPAVQYRAARTRAFQTWAEVAGVAAQAQPPSSACSQ